MGDMEKPLRKNTSPLGEVSPEEALRPDKGQEKDFVVNNNPFGVTPGELNKMQNPKSLPAYAALGGLPGIEKALRTDVNSGLSADEGKLHGSVSRAVDVAQLDRRPTNPLTPIQSRDAAAASHATAEKFVDRKRVFKDNRLPPRKTYTILSLLWTAYNDKILWLLTVAAVVSLALGLYETFENGSSIDWVEGAAITVAILIVVLVTAFNDWQKEKQFTKLNQKVSYVWEIWNSRVGHLANDPLRKRTARSRSCDPVKRPPSPSTTSLSVMSCTLSPATPFPRTASSSAATESSATSPQRPASPTPSRKHPAARPGSGSLPVRLRTRLILSSSLGARCWRASGRSSSPAPASTPATARSCSRFRSRPSRRPSR